MTLSKDMGPVLLLPLLKARPPLLSCLALLLVTSGAPGGCPILFPLLWLEGAGTLLQVEHAATQ